jgi:hypothetical protein
MTENTQNTVPFEYTLRPLPNQPAYTPVVGEPWNPPPVATYLHLQVQLPFVVNRDYGLAIDWPTDAGMRPSANKVISLASNKTYNAGTLELTEDGALMARFKGEDGVNWNVKLEGEPAEFVKTALAKLFAHDYTVEAMQLEDEDEEPDDDNDEQPTKAIEWYSDPDDDEGNDEYED